MKNLRLSCCYATLLLSMVVQAADHGHSHLRDKMMISDLGNHHALLTAHLAKAGNELDIFIESGKTPKPMALKIQTFTTDVIMDSGTKHKVKFTCAPKSERPKAEKKGTCSHFVGSAPWLKRTDVLALEMNVAVTDKKLVAQWLHFNPLRYAHHIE